MAFISATEGCSTERVQRKGTNIGERKTTSSKHHVCSDILFRMSCSAPPFLPFKIGPAVFTDADNKYISGAHISWTSARDVSRTPSLYQRTNDALDVGSVLLSCCACCTALATPWQHITLAGHLQLLNFSRHFVFHTVLYFLVSRFTFALTFLNHIRFYLSLSATVLYYDFNRSNQPSSCYR
jgi:hypothetical protein